MTTRRLSQFMNEYKPFFKEFFSRGILLGNFFCLLHVTNNYLCSPILVYGPSMLPTLNLTGDVLLVDHLSTALGRVDAGDVVVVRSPENPRKSITKRVLAVEGEKITFLVNPSRSGQTRSLMVPKGHVWIQGDNIYSSWDSRNFGPVPYALLKGRAFWRLEIQFPYLKFEMLLLQLSGESRYGKRLKCFSLTKTCILDKRRKQAA